MIFLAWFAAAGVDGIAELLTKKKKHLKALVATCLLFIFFVAVTPTILWEIRQKIDPKNMPSPIIYIPSSAYDAFRFIAKDPLWQHVTLGNPVSYTDTIAPALTGHKSYSGHPLTTIRSEEKKAQATAFFKLDMTEDQAYTFLKSIPITYVIYMVYDGDINVFRGTYRFLTPVFSSPGATVFTIK